MNIAKKAICLALLALFSSEASGFSTRQIVSRQAQEQQYSNFLSKSKSWSSPIAKDSSKKLFSSVLFSTEEDEKEKEKENTSIVAVLDDLAKSFKPRAQKAEAKCYQAESTSKKIMYTLQSSCYYLLFLLYRAYRGIFLLLPAVFRNVYKKMEKAVDSELSLEDDATLTSDRPVTWRTKITVSLITTIITASYVVGGTLRVLTRFLRTISKTSSVPKSFEAAADEVDEHEKRMNRSMGKGGVNGEKQDDGSAFYP